MAEITLHELRRWLTDCQENARKKGLSEEEILLAFLAETQALIVKVLLNKSAAK